MNEEAKTKMTRARVALIMRQPFFGTLALRLLLKEDDTLDPPTLAVDGQTLYYHPQWVVDNDLDIVMSGVGHEVGHCVFDHLGRRGGREPYRWNCAGDYVVNGVLKDCGFVVPPTWLYSASFLNQSADEIYEQLPPTPPGDKPGQGPFDKHFDKPASDTNKSDWEIAGIQAANAARNKGNLPASLQRFVDTIVAPKADWRAVMRRFMTESAKEDYSYARMHRKFLALGVYLPGLYSEAMGEVIGVIDTSGSISEPIFSAFVAELDELRNQLRPVRMSIIQCDAAIGKVDQFEQGDEFKIEAIGGGGTDFRPPFEWARKEGIEPKAFLYLTDGYGPFPEVVPPYPVLWLMTTDVIPPFGEVVRIEI